MKNPFYYTPEGQQFLHHTDGGKFAYVWAVKLVDGTEVKEFDDVQFHRLMTDPAPQMELESKRGTVSKLDVKTVKEFYLLPTAYTRSIFSHLEPVRLVVDLEAGEKFISYWEVDVDAMTGQRFYRRIVGISKPINGSQAKFFVVLNPNGKTTITTNPNLSFDGE